MLKDYSEEAIQTRLSPLSVIDGCSTMDAADSLLESDVVPDFFTESDLVHLLELDEHLENERREHEGDQHHIKETGIEHHSQNCFEVHSNPHVNNTDLHMLEKDHHLKEILSQESNLLYPDDKLGLEPLKAESDDETPLFHSITHIIPSQTANLSTHPAAPHSSAFKTNALPFQLDALDSREPNSVFQARIRANKKYFERSTHEKNYDTKDSIRSLDANNRVCALNFTSSDSKTVPYYPTKVDHGCCHEASIEHLMDMFAFETKKRKRLLETSEEGKYVEPRDVDVLLGRGGRANKHPGNERYHKEKAALQPKYRLASKEDKTDISQDLVDIVHQYGGRFLKFDDQAGKWYEVANLVARRKASQALREESTPEKRAAKRAKYPAKSRAKGDKSPRTAVQAQPS